jgi:hypothetical protein
MRGKRIICATRVIATAGEERLNCHATSVESIDLGIRHSQIRLTVDYLAAACESVTFSQNKAA